MEINFNSKSEWMAEVARLKAYFESVQLPATLQINAAAKSNNLVKSINTLLLRAGANAGNQVFKGFIVDLQEIEKRLKEEGF